MIQYTSECKHNTWFKYFLLFSKTLGIKFCALMLSENDLDRENTLLHQLILPWMKKYDSNDLPKEVIEIISPPGTK